MEENSTPKALDLEVRVYPAREPDKVLLATANVTLGGCFAVKGIHILDGERGPFISMPQWKDSKGVYHEVCFPVTKEMREKLSDAVLGEYQRTMEREYARAGQAIEKMSLMDRLQERPAAGQPEKKRPSGRDER